MVREIIRDVQFLMKKSVPATKSDLQIALDLKDTLIANSQRCVGLAANMIGERKNIIAINTGMVPIVMINPKIISHSQERYETEEGCLSLDGVRKTKRYMKIEVEYFDTNFVKHRNTYTGFAAQIIQHELDHCSGKLI